MHTSLSRYQQIAEILARQGLGFLVTATGLSHRLGARAMSGSAEPLTNPERVRVALEELGPTFIKLGQLLSTRPDLLPPDYIAQLSRLQDAAPPVPAEEIHATIRDEFGRGPDELFASFDDTPLASASIGQVHSAVRHDGTAVVVKVRRPQAVRQVQEDLEILSTLADRASRLWPAARDYDLRGLVQVFAQTLRAELDYVREGHNAEHIAQDFAERPDVLVPRVYWDTTTSRVLTLERMTGIKVGDTAALDAAHIDRRALAATGANIVLTMIFEHRFFHADMHPGNLFAEPDGALALIDFGMVGQISEDLRDRLADVFVASTFRDADALTSALIALCVPRGSVDRLALRAKAASFFAQYSDQPLGDIHFSRLAADLLRVLREQHLQLPHEIALAVRVLVETEGVGVQLDADFDLNTVLTPYARRLIAKRLSAPALAKRIARASRDAGALLVELPTRLRRILDIMDQSGVEVHLRASELEPLVGRAEQIGNRLVAGMITAALINGVGQLTASNPRDRSGRTALLSAGLTAFAGLSGYLLWTARRHRG